MLNQKNKTEKFTAIGSGYMKIVFDHGNVANWTNNVYAPNHDRAALLQDKYDYQFDWKNTDNGKLTINKMDLITLIKNSCG